MTHDEAIEAAARVEAAELYRDGIGLGPDHPLRATETEKNLARALLALDERAKAMEAAWKRVGSVLSDVGCDCLCDCGNVDERGECNCGEIDRCVAHQVEDAWKAKAALDQQAAGEGEG